MKIHFDRPIGPVRAIHGICQPPVFNNDCSRFAYLKQAGIPYSRLHDMGTQRLYPRVDVPCIFPDFDADENDPSNYEFPMTDEVVLALVKNGCEPYYHLGPMIENAVGAGHKPRYIQPPKDFAKWARICEHIIAHYNEGWANGYHLGLRYWEIWNEPDFGVPEANIANQQWTGTPEQFFELYTVASKHLKARFGDSIKVGGYGSCGPHAILAEPEKYGIPAHLKYVYSDGSYDPRLTYIHRFLEHVVREKAPLEFFSWHSYNNTERTFYGCRYLRGVLDDYGFTDCELHLNEWNNGFRDQRGTVIPAGHAATMLIRMQDAPIDMMMYYDARFGIGMYAGMFDTTADKPFCLYYVFKAFNEMVKLGTRVECDPEHEDFYVMAATDGKRRGILLTNAGERFLLRDLPQNYTLYVVDETNEMREFGPCPDKWSLKQYQTLLLLED